jgi:hypothetical protein
VRFEALRSRQCRFAGDVDGLNDPDGGAGASNLPRAVRLDLAVELKEIWTDCVDQIEDPVRRREMGDENRRDVRGHLPCQRGCPRSVQSVFGSMRETADEADGVDPRSDGQRDIATTSISAYLDASTRASLVERPAGILNHRTHRKRKRPDSWFRDGSSEPGSQPGRRT